MLEFGNWREWGGELRAGHFWTRDLRAARGALLAGCGALPEGGHAQFEWRSLRLRAGEADCVICELPEDAEALQAYIWSDLGGSTAARGWPAPPTRSSCTCSERSARCRSSGSRSWPAPASCAVRPLRVRPRGAGERRLPRADPGEDQPGEFACDCAGEPLQPCGVRDLCQYSAHWIRCSLADLTGGYCHELTKNRFGLGKPRASTPMCAWCSPTPTGFRSTSGRTGAWRPRTP